MVLLLVATARGVLPFVDGERQPIELGDRRIRGLAGRSGDWCAVADEHTVVQRADDGSWADLGTSEASLACVLPAPGGAWCGTSDGQLLRLHDGAFAHVDGFAAVEGRERWHAVGSREPYVRSITETSDHRALLASVHVGGIPRSGNGGATWKPTIDPDADVHQVRAAPNDRGLVLAPAAIGLAVSRDAGATWNVLTDGLHASYLRAVAFTRGDALVSACDGPFGARGALYRWDTLSGGALARVRDGLPEWLVGNVDTGKLDAHDDAVAFADAESVYVSVDGATTWSRLDIDATEITGIGIHVDTT